MEQQVKQLKQANSELKNKANNSESMALVKVPNRAVDRSKALHAYSAKQDRGGGSLTPNRIHFNPKAPSWNPHEGEAREPPRAPRAMLAAGLSSIPFHDMKVLNAPHRPRTPFLMSVPGTNIDIAANYLPIEPSKISAHRKHAGIVHNNFLNDSYLSAFCLNRPPTVMPPFLPLNHRATTFNPYEVSKPGSYKKPWNHDDIKLSVDHIYELAKGYIVDCHKGGQPNVPDEMMAFKEPNTWLFMVDLVHENTQEGIAHMNWLLSEPSYRPYILQRMIIEYLFKKMLTPSVFQGFSTDMDGHLAALQEQITVMNSRKFSYPTYPHVFLASQKFKVQR